MSAIDCRRVRNPSVLQQQQRVLTEPSKTKKLRELSSAWTLLGETKSSLNELDDKLSSESLSSQRKNRGREEHQRNKPHSVSFLTSAQSPKEKEGIYQQPALNSSAYLESANHSPSVLLSSSSSSPRHSNSTSVFGTSRSKYSPPKSGAESLTTTKVGRNTHHYIPRTSVTTTVVRKTTSLPETTDSNLSLSKARVALLKARLDKQKRDLEGRRSTGSVRSLSPGVSSDPTLGNTQGSIKRKVAVAPPPRTYAGFSTNIRKPPLHSSKTASSFSRNVTSKPATTSHPLLSQHSTHTYRSTVAPSSWRSGRQLANQILSQEIEPQLPHMSDGYSSSTSSLSPPPSRRSPTHRPVTRNLNAATLLSDIRRVEREVADDLSPRRVTKKPEFTSGRYRRYDPETVKVYMQHKEDERKRKARENVLAQQRKELDMNLRLLELQRTQKRVLNTNLLSQKTKSEQQRENKTAASLAKQQTYPTQSHRITSSRSHASPPTTYRHSSPPRTTLYASVSSPHTLTSPHRQTPASNHLQAPSSHLQTNLSSRHQLPGPPRHHTSSVTHDRLLTPRSPASPRPTSSLDQPPASAHISPRPQLSVSPPPANFSTSSLSSSSSSLSSASSSSSSPSRSLPLHALPSRALISHTSPVRDSYPAATITEAVSSLASAVTASTSSCSHAVTVVTSSRPQTVSLTPSLITSSRSITDVQFADHSPQARVRLTFSSPPSQNPPFTSDQAVSVPPAGPVDPSLQRLQVIKQSALLLKQKIAAEKQRLLLEKEKRKAAHFTLPGAENVPVSASSVKRINDKEAAATKIQSAWRGHRLRVTRSMSPEPSSPIISTSCPHILSPAVTVSRLPHLLTSTAPPTQVQTSPKPQIPPWEQAGGDKLSVINIFTKHQHPLPPEVKIESTTPPSSLHYTGSFEDDQSTIRSSPSLPIPADYTPSPTPTPSALSPLLHHESTPTPAESTSSEEEEQQGGVPVITPPGSSSFCSVYVPTEKNPVESPSVTEEPRYSPHSLEVQMRAHLNALDTVGEGIRQLDKLERTKDACQMQQKSLSIAQLIQSQRRTELDAINTETKQELDKTHKRIDKLEQDVQDRFETEHKQSRDHVVPVTLSPCISTAERAVQTTTEVQKPRTVSSISTASTFQVTPISIKTPPPVSTCAIAAPTVAESSISTVISDSTNATSSINTTSASIPATLYSSVEENYQSDFDPTTTIHEDSLDQDGTPVVEAPTTVLSPTVTSSLLSPLPTNQPLLSPHPSGGSTDSATPVPSEYERKDEEEEAAEERRATEEVDVKNRTLTAQTVSEMLSEFDNNDQEEEEIEEEISKTSFRELLPSESHRRMVLHGRPSTLSVSSDSDSLLATPAASGEVTPFQGEESFYHFVTRMVQQYVREEEMRGKHQTALLQLREKALQEKTQAELKWLNVKKTHLQDKGADDQMPPLVKREKGLIQKFKHEQAEIKRLKEAHEVASRERRLLLLQQKDIARMRKHTQYYNSKISHFSHHGGHEQSPGSESSSPPSPTIPTTQQEVSEQLSRSFSSSRELLTDISVSSSLPPSPVKPSHATVFSDQTGPESPAMKTLRQITTAENERKLREREAALKLQRKAAEEVLLAQQELRKKEMQLDKEEEEIKKLIEQASKYQRRPVLSVSASLPDVATMSPQTATKDSSVEEVLEELPSSAGYSADTFEDTPEHTPLTTSTPAAAAREPSSDDFLTSDGSEIELRVIRLKKEVKAKEKEMRKAQRDQKKRKKEALRQQEEKLAQQLMAHDSVLKTLHNETPPAQALLVEDKPQELATQAFIHEKPMESVSASEIEESMSLDPAGSPDSSISSASTVVSIPDYLLDKSPNLQVEEEKLTTEEEIEEQQFELTEETRTEITVESQNEVTEDLEEEMEIEEELELEDHEEFGESPRVLSPLIPSPAEQDIMSSDQIASPQQTSYTSSSFEQPTIEQPHPEPLQDSPQLSAVSLFSLPPEDQVPESFYAGQRVIVGDSVEGVVRYYGRTGFAPGMWVGVEFDEPCGKNDGSVRGHRYFTCLPLHGVYAPPSKVAALITPSSSGKSVQDFYKDVITAESLSPRSTEDWQQLETPADEEKDELSEIAESISQEEANQVVQDIMQWESETEQMSQNLVRELSDEAFNMIHSKWKEKENEANANAVNWEHYLDPDHDPEFELVPEDDDDQPAAVEQTSEQRAERLREEKADAIADSIVEQLFESDFNLMHNLSVAHAPPESPPSTPPPHEAPRPSVPPKEVAPLCFVPGSKPSVDMIATTAWNNLKNVGEATAISKTPPPELISQLCGQPPEHCAESFVYLVYQLAVEIILDDNRQTFCQVGNLSSWLSPKSLTLADVQKSVYRQVTAGQHPPSLPPVKYLHKNTRPGGKPVDFVDSILIRELREDEPSWVDYSQEEKQVKERVADSIMDMLLTETAEIFDSIENKNSQQS